MEAEGERRQAPMGETTQGLQASLRSPGLIIREQGDEKLIYETLKTPSIFLLLKFINNLVYANNTF